MSDDWIELKGEALQLRVIQNKPDSNENVAQWTDTVLVDYEGRQCDDRDAPFESYPVCQSGKQLVVTFTDQMLVKALEIAFIHLHAGQTALVYATPKFALGETQKRSYNDVVVPPNSNVIYKVTLHHILMNTGRINPYLPIQKAIAQKTIANDLYQCEWPGQRDRAMTLYEKAARDMETLLHGTYLTNVAEPDHPQRKQVKELMLDNLNNIVAVYLRSKQYEKAYEAAQLVLRRDASNAKALLRAAKACMMSRQCSRNDQDDALCAAEKAITYKDKEEVELKKLRMQWKLRKQMAFASVATE
ncbi:hypothetical protein MPSEU_000839600 [Mayamaea pseudoterrestris]|nr:hypothetical protein MPSEU_000839600 [Mayamaea pseudoterrestris]